MSEGRIFSDRFTEAHSDDPEMMQLTAKVEEELSLLLEQYGVASWQELPEEVLESFSVTMPVSQGESGGENA